MKEYARKFILQKAREVFLNKGFKGATIEEIAQASNLSKPTIYNYFTGKRALFLSVLDDLHEEVAEIIRPFIEEEAGPFTERLKGLTDAVSRFFFHHSGLIKIMMSEQNFIMEMAAGNDMNVIRRHFSHGVVLAALIEFFQKAGEKGEISDSSDPELVSMVYVGMLSRIQMYLTMIECNESELLAKTRQAIEIFCFGICRDTSSAGPESTPVAGENRRKR